MDHYRIKTHSRSTSEEKSSIDNHIENIAQIIIKASDKQVKRNYMTLSNTNFREVVETPFS